MGTNTLVTIKKLSMQSQEIGHDRLNSNFLSDEVLSVVTSEVPKAI